MDQSKLQALWVVLCCLVISLFSEIQCMDTALDMEETKHKASHSESYSDDLKPESDEDLRDTNEDCNKEDIYAPQTTHYASQTTSSLNSPEAFEEQERPNSRHVRNERNERNENDCGDDWSTMGPLGCLCLIALKALFWGIRYNLHS